MRKTLDSSTVSAVRAVLLGGVLSAIFAGPACTRQTFDLLQDATGGAKAGTAGAGGATSSAGGSVAGDNGHNPGGGGDRNRGGGSSLGGGGSGGAAITDAGGAPQGPCLSGDSCVEGGLTCPPTENSCRRCTTGADCEGLQAHLCDVPDGRCAECLGDMDCRADELCHPLTKRCMHFCKTSADCVNENQKPMCDAFHTCVTCIDASDCRQLTGHNDECAFGTCVECLDSRQCPMDRPHCVGLQCLR